MTKRALRPMLVLLFAMLPWAAGAQQAVGDAGDGDTIKAGDVAFLSGFNALYRLDLATGAATVVGSGFGVVSGVPVADVDSLAFAPDGTLYAVADSPQALFRISTTTGRASLAAVFRENGQPIADGGRLDAALTFTCTGKLLMSSRSERKLWEVDPNTGTVTLVGPLSISIGGMAANRDNVYALGVGSSVGLYDLSATDGSNQRRPASFNGQTIPGGSLAFTGDDRLFAVFDLYPPVERSVLAQISPETGEVLREVTLTGPQLGAGSDRRVVRALAMAPPVCSTILVPGQATVAVPASTWSGLLVLAGALMLLGAFALRRRSRF